MRLCNNTNKASMSTKLLACTKNIKLYIKIVHVHKTK